MRYKQLIRSVFLLGCIVGVVYCGRTPRPESTESAPIEDSVPECTYTAQSSDSVA